MPASLSLSLPSLYLSLCLLSLSAFSLSLPSHSVWVYSVSQKYTEPIVIVHVSIIRLYVHQPIASFVRLLSVVNLASWAEYAKKMFLFLCYCDEKTKQTNSLKSLLFVYILSGTTCISLSHSQHKDTI